MDKEKMSYDLALIYAKEMYRNYLESPAIANDPKDFSPKSLLDPFIKAYNFYINSPSVDAVEADD